MAFRTVETWLGQIQQKVSERVAQWSAAIDLLAAPGLEPGRATRTEAERLGLAFARYLTGAINRDELEHTANAAHPDAFWASLEAFTDNIAGEEWRTLARPLLAVKEVQREWQRLRHPSPWRRALAARHLGLLGARGMRRPLQEAMARGPALVTFTAALALARMGDREGLRWLLEHPGAIARRSRRQLVALLKRFGPEALPELREALAGWSVASPIHLATIEVVGLWKDPLSLPLLERVMREGVHEARVAAARSLGRIASPRALPALIAALDDETWEVRAQAARSLGSIPDESALPHLAACVRDVAWWVRRNAAYALALQGEPGRRALEALARQSEDAFAADIAREVLQLLEWEHESPGGIARVV